MNCLCKATSANVLATGLAESALAVVGISVHGIGISVFENKFLTFGL